MTIRVGIVNDLAIAAELARAGASDGEAFKHMLKHRTTGSGAALRSNFLVVEERNHHWLVPSFSEKCSQGSPTRNLIVYSRRSDEFRIFTEDLSLLRVNQLRGP